MAPLRTLHLLIIPLMLQYTCFALLPATNQLSSKTTAIPSVAQPTLQSLISTMIITTNLINNDYHTLQSQKSSTTSSTDDNALMSQSVVNQENAVLTKDFQDILNSINTMNINFMNYFKNLGTQNIHSTVAIVKNDIIQFLAILGQIHFIIHGMERINKLNSKARNRAFELELAQQLLEEQLQNKSSSTKSGKTTLTQKTPTKNKLHQLEQKVIRLTTRVQAKLAAEQPLRFQRTNEINLTIHPTNNNLLDDTLLHPDPGQKTPPQQGQGTIINTQNLHQTNSTTTLSKKTPISTITQVPARIITTTANQTGNTSTSIKNNDHDNNNNGDEPYWLDGEEYWPARETQPASPENSDI